MVGSLVTQSLACLLALDPGTPLKNLDGTARRAIAFLDEARQSMADEIDGVLRGQYQPTLLHPHTVGSYLFGCRQVSYGDAPRECSLFCRAGESLDTKATDDDNTCRYNTFRLGERSPIVEILGTVSGSDEGLIYVDDKWKGRLGRSDAKVLSGLGIRRVRILDTKNNRHASVLGDEMMPLDDVPTIIDDGDTSSSGRAENTTPSASTQSERRKVRLLMTGLVLLAIGVTTIYAVAGSKRRSDRPSS